MKGFVPTPPDVVDQMVAALFNGRRPKSTDKLLDPGCGVGAFIDGVLRWCAANSSPIPAITGVESNPTHVRALRKKYRTNARVKIELRDYLRGDEEPFDFVIGNPPYVSITKLSQDEKTRYRQRYLCARGRFDLYLLFFEQAMRNLASDGRLAFITPEKFLYVDTARPLRALLRKHHVEAIHFVDEATFGDLVTYPTITVLRNSGVGETRVVRRDGVTQTLRLPAHDESWISVLTGASTASTGPTLSMLCSRITCGIATGADKVFVHRKAALSADLLPFAVPTISGRDLAQGAEAITSKSAMLMPYGPDGTLMPWNELGALMAYLSRDEIRATLLRRTCATRKAWYAFHETPMVREILRPKILCKDISPAPLFWADHAGEFVPRHSVYYVVPRNPSALAPILKFMRSDIATEWLMDNCQRAAKGYLRLQSRILQRLPVPTELIDEVDGLAPYTIEGLQGQVAFTR